MLNGVVRRADKSFAGAVKPRKGKIRVTEARRADINTQKMLTLLLSQ